MQLLRRYLPLPRKEPESASAGVGIRAGVPKQASYLYLRNPGDRPRSLVVELAAGGRQFTAAVKLPPGATVPVRFPPPPLAAVQPAATGVTGRKEP